MPSGGERDRLIKYLKTKGILAVFHYLPLHLSDMGMQLGGKRFDCKVTENISRRLIRLPFYNKLTITEQQAVIEAIMKFY